MKNDFSFNNNRYHLVGIINTPEYNHFTGTLVKYNIGFNGLKQNYDYYYDGMSLDNNISLIKNLDEFLEDNILYGSLYLLKKYHLK